MSGLRVLHVDSGRRYGGGQRQVRLLARELAARGVPQTLALPPGSALAAAAAGEGLEVRPLEQRCDLDLAGAWRLAALCRELRPSVVHSHSARALALVALARPLIGRPRPALIHTRRVSFPVKGLLGGVKLRAGADRFVAISRAAADRLRSAGVPEQRVSVIPSGVELAGAEDRERSRAEVLALGGFAPGDVVVGACGTLLGVKRFDLLVRAVAALAGELPPVRLVVWGEGPRLPALIALRAVLGAGHSIVFAGHVAEPERWFSGVDVFALASESEGLGSVLLDAMARGVPLVGAAAPGIDEAIADGVNGLLFAPGSVEELSRALRRLALDPALRRRLGEAGPRLAAERYDIKGVAARTLALYRDAGGEG